MKTIRCLPLLFICLLLLASLAGCDSTVETSEQSLDTQLRRAIEAAADDGLDAFQLPASDDLAAIPQDPRNRLTAAKIELGRFLFHETALAAAPVREAGRGTYTCATCHHAGAGFQAGRRQAIAEGGRGFGQTGEGRSLDPAYAPDEADVQPIRTPTALHGAWQRVVFWNGQFGATGPNAGTEDQWLPGTPAGVNRRGYEGLESQAIAAFVGHRLVGGPAAVAEALPAYRQLFDDAFPERPAAERVTEETAGLAIAAYERTLVAHEAPFQRWLRGETDAMTDAEKRGALVFFGKGGCATCHSGPALSSETFHALGLGDLEGPDLVGTYDPLDPVHLGRGGFTGRDEDRYRFKTPQLYNLADHVGFGHGATLASIRAVVVYKNEGVAQVPYFPSDRLSPHVRPLGLTDAEVDDLTAFLEHGLYDPSLDRYVPEVVPSGQCFPANDAQSRRDLGCDDAARFPR